MKRLLTLLLIVPMLVMAQDPPQMTDIFEVTIKHGHEMQFHEGMKKYKKCHMDNKTGDQWNSWWRVQGEGSVVAFTRDIQNFAQLDKEMSGNNACQEIIQNDLIPHSTSTNRSILRNLNNWSNSNPPEGTVVSITYFSVNDPWVFEEKVTEVVNTIKEVKGDVPGYWLSATGNDDFDYMLVRFYDNFAGMDKDDFNPWKIYAEKHGKEKLKKLRDEMNKSLKNVTENMYMLDPTISYDGMETSGN